jgi:diguanylate cyclase (GGDEF)-like protein/PAS domain S-box-containing protein
MSPTINSAILYSASVKGERGARWILESILLGLRRNPWRVLILVVLFSEILTFIMNTIMGLIWWGRVDKDLLMIGTIDALVVSLIVGAFCIGILLYLLNYNDRLSNLLSQRTEELHSVNLQLKERLDELTRAMEEVHNSERFLRTIFESIRDPFCIIDRDFRIVRANDAYLRVKGKSIDDLIGGKCYETLYGRDSVCDACVIDKTFKSGEPCLKEKFVPRPEGYGEWVEIYTYPIFMEGQEVSHVIQYVRSITDRKRSEEEKRMLIERLERLSRTDGLTGMLNKRGLMERLQTEFERVKRYGGSISLLICDIDDFKYVNDLYGHSAGDNYLKLVAQAMYNSIRSADIIGRFGGDEFMVILQGVEREEAMKLAERIRSIVEDTVLKVDIMRSVKSTVSVGVATFDSTESYSVTTPEELIKAADDALYRAKNKGKNRVELYLYA